MRMEELSANRYLKGPDSVEKYLLGIVQDYFANSTVASEQSREAVIKKSLQRMKEEINFDSVGVLSITLPDGVLRNGVVNISLEDLGGEPLIPVKHSAFNVDFGNTVNTACEGNDPRLSDARPPLEHTHSIEDVLGLSGELSTLNAKYDRLEHAAHEHDNKSVLDIITYSGDRTSIDLIEIENIKSTIENNIADISQAVEECKTDLTSQIIQINDTILSINEAIESIKDEMKDAESAVLVANAQALQEAKEYTNEQVNETKEFIEEKLSECATADTVNALVNSINQTYKYLGTATAYTVGTTSGNVDITEIQALLNAHNPSYTAADVVVDTYVHIDGQKYPSPYLIYNENEFIGFIQTFINGLNVSYNIVGDTSKLTTAQANASVTAVYYVKQSVDYFTKNDSEE